MSLPFALPDFIAFTIAMTADFAVHDKHKGLSFVGLKDNTSSLAIGCHLVAISVVGSSN